LRVIEGGGVGRVKLGGEGRGGEQRRCSMELKGWAWWERKRTSENEWGGRGGGGEVGERREGMVKVGRVEEGS